MPSSEIEEYVNENICSARESLEGCPNNVVYGVALRRIMRQAFQAGRRSTAPDEIEKLRFILTEADKRIVWEGRGLGNDFSERVESQPSGVGDGCRRWV